jgi:hypothetical protein
MVGLYPDAPGMMIQYDRDADALYYDGGWVTMNSTQRANLNKTPAVNAYSTTVWATNYVGVVFPEPYDIVGHSNASAGGTGNNVIETSVDTTNGQDGTWVSRGGFSTAGFRAPTTVSWAGIKGIRWSFFNGSANKMSYYGVHIYGQPSAAALTAFPNRLRFWHPTLDQLLSGPGLDFGDLPRASTGTKQFRIKNNSATQTANGVVLSSESLNDASPTIVGVQAFDDGTGYASTKNIGALAPGAISGIITMRTVPTSTAVVGAWRQRARAIATNWS